MMNTQVACGIVWDECGFLSLDCSLIYPPELIAPNCGGGEKRSSKGPNVQQVGECHHCHWHLDILVACHLLCLVASLKAAGKLVWYNRVGTPWFGQPSSLDEHLWF